MLLGETRTHQTCMPGLRPGSNPISCWDCWVKLPQLSSFPRPHAQPLLKTLAWPVQDLGSVSPESDSWDIARGQLDFQCQNPDFNTEEPRDFEQANEPLSLPWFPPCGVGA